MYNNIQRWYMKTLLVRCCYRRHTILYLQTSLSVHDTEELWNANVVRKHATMMLQLYIQPLHVGMKDEWSGRKRQCVVHLTTMLKMHSLADLQIIAGEKRLRQACRGDTASSPVSPKTEPEQCLISTHIKDIAVKNDIRTSKIKCVTRSFHSRVMQSRFYQQEIWTFS